MLWSIYFGIVLVQPTRPPPVCAADLSDINLEKQAWRFYHVWETEQDVSNAARKTTIHMS